MKNKTNQKYSNEKSGNLSSLINYQCYILLLVHGVSNLNNLYFIFVF